MIYKKLSHYRGVYVVNLSLYFIDEILNDCDNFIYTALHIFLNLKLRLSYFTNTSRKMTQMT